MRFSKVARWWHAAGWTRLFSLCLVLICAAAPAARAGSALWIADANNDRVDEYLPSQLTASGTPTPLTIPIGTAPFGVCFDKSKNLWVPNGAQTVVGFTAAQLKMLPTAPTPAVTISSASFSDIVGCAFDKHGNLWVIDISNGTLNEITAAQLQAGTNSIMPPIIITDSEISSSDPYFITFDKSGNLWADGRDTELLYGFTASQLSSSGSKTAGIVLSNAGSLSDPGQIGFDGKGNLWVTSYDNDRIMMFPKAQLGASNNDGPAVTLKGGPLVGPWGLAFRGGNLWVLDYGDGAASGFLPSELKTTGFAMPKVVLTDAAATQSYAITFGPAFGKLQNIGD